MRGLNQCKTKILLVVFFGNFSVKEIERKNFKTFHLTILLKTKNNKSYPSYQISNYPTLILSIPLNRFPTKWLTVIKENSNIWMRPHTRILKLSGRCNMAVISFIRGGTTHRYDIPLNTLIITIYLFQTHWHFYWLLRNESRDDWLLCTVMCRPGY